MSNVVPNAILDSNLRQWIAVNAAIDSNVSIDVFKLVEAYKEDCGLRVSKTVMMWNLQDCGFTVEFSEGNYFVNASI